ncbi:MAG TPA: choice-of-anchor B family protein [Nitriliruptoraceae bacterium]|nr:choice-of-anchor B family protein [Nitriliruptoraceae bacterium]
MPTTTARRPHARATRLVIVLAMVAATLAAVPTTARAHALCGPLTGMAATVARALDAVNVFRPIVDTSATACPDQFADVEPVARRDWVGDQVAGAPSEAERAEGARMPRGKSNKPQTKANCDDGMAAGEFACDNVAIWSHVSMDELGGPDGAITFVNDMWGWTDAQTRKDYALVGTGDGVVIVDISDKLRPVVNGILPTSSTDGGFFWRDLKVYANHMFVGSEHENHGIQVFDLTRLRDWDGTYTTYDEETIYTGVGASHNVAINEDTGYLYVMGADPSQSINGCGTGLHMVDIQNPTNPTFAGCYDDDNYIHDTQCVVYDGPDADYQGHELCFNAAPETPAGTSDPRDSFSVTDVTDKANPVRLFDDVYDGGPFGYSHQGWLTDDKSTFFSGDELDEFVSGIPTVTRSWDVSDLDNPVRMDDYFPGTTSVDHNMYIEDDLMYQSNYTSGLRVVDVSDPANPQEVGYFDMYPESEAANFDGGNWSNYPYFRQPNVVAASSIDRGLFILNPDAG